MVISKTALQMLENARGYDEHIKAGRDTLGCYPGIAANESAIDRAGLEFADEIMADDSEQTLAKLDPTVVAMSAKEASRG